MRFCPTQYTATMRKLFLYLCVLYNDNSWNKSLLYVSRREARFWIWDAGYVYNQNFGKISLDSSRLRACVCDGEGELGTGFRFSRSTKLILEWPSLYTTLDYIGPSSPFLAPLIYGTLQILYCDLIFLYMNNVFKNEWIKLTQKNIS